MIRKNNEKGICPCCGEELEAIATDYAPHEMGASYTDHCEECSEEFIAIRNSDSTIEFLEMDEDEDLPDAEWRKVK